MLRGCPVSQVKVGRGQTDGSCGRGTQLALLNQGPGVAPCLPQQWAGPGLVSKPLTISFPACKLSAWAEQNVDAHFRGRNGRTSEDGE